MSIDRKALVGFISEIEASRDRAKGETRHQSEIFKAAREKGFEPKAMRKVLQRRAMSAVDRDSIDEAVDLYEHALGALADAREAVEGGMSAREASEKFDVPRAALGVIARGSRNAISEPDHDEETGEITETAARSENATPSGGEGTAVTSGPGIASATHSEAETGSATLVTAGNLDALSPDSFHPGPDSCSTDADRLRAQIPASTDPAWLEREADRLDLPSFLDRRQKAAT